MPATPLHYAERGFGEAIVFLPGLGGTHTMYQDQLTEFGGAYRAIAVDLRGNGGSPRLGGPVDRVLSAQAADVIRLLDDLEIKRAHFVGISYGGVVAQQIVLDHRARCRSVTICDSFCDTTATTLAEQVSLASARLTPLMYRLPKPLLTSFIAGAYQKWPKAGRLMADYMRHARLPELTLQRKAINDVHFTTRLSLIEIPTLAMVGDHVPQAVSMMRHVATTMRTELRVISNSFDPSNLCQPERFNALLREFLAQERLA